ncbi:MAG TPA: hypothetical protein VJ345_06130, partial [Anaerolineales bacterium]|nr:hypothetical protein [Anaerolineales bacterium]
PADPSFEAAVLETQRLFAQDLPSVPLYMRPRVLAHTLDLCGVVVDPSGLSPFWNLEDLTRGADC